MTTVIQRSFAGGELAPSLYARVDQSRYQTGARTLRNFLLMRHGGAQNRPGSEFIGEVKDSDTVARLIPFVFNADQTYVLEFGSQYMRVIRDGAYQSDLSLFIDSISAANPAVVTYTGTDPVNGQEVAISGILGDLGQYVNGRNFKIGNVNGVANTFELSLMDGSPFDSSALPAYIPFTGGTAARVYEISTPYSAGDLSSIQFVQSADVLTLVHPSYAPRELTRSGHTAWTLSTITFTPSIAAPGSQAATQNGATGSTTYNYKVTSVAEETFEESLPPGSPATVANGNATLTATNNISITWSAVSGAQEYNVYRELNGVYGFIGVAGGTSFVDVGYTPDTTDTPPIERNPFNASDSYPSTVTYFQQRLTFANTNDEPEKVWASRSGQFKNFTISSPIQSDDAITFTLAGRQVNEVRHLIDIGKLVILTSGGEWVANGDAAGVLTPTDINAKQNGYTGSAEIAPIIIGGNALYLQARGSIVRDLVFDYQVEGYRGNDLTIFSSHLFDGHSIVDWAYQQVPHSIVWAVRDDGMLLGLTYVREHQMFGWHRHDTDGTYENVCVVPEGDEDAVYVVVKRNIDGADKRYVERFAQRRIEDIVDSKFVDSFLTYDGRNTTGVTMTMSGGTTWEYSETLTLTSSSAFFGLDEVGNAIFITGSDGTVIRFTITGFTSTTIVTGQPHATVPVAMRNTATTNWARAIDEVGGLWHLEGKTVSVTGDGYVVANPNNESYTEVTVTDGVATLDQPYSVVHVGLPYLSDIETLDIDTTQGETMIEKYKNITEVSLYVEASRGIWIGGRPPSDDSTDPLEGLFEYKARDDEDYGEPVQLATSNISVAIQGEWNSNGRVFVRQVDPIPLSVLAVAPSGLLPLRGG